MLFKKKKKRKKVFLSFNWEYPCLDGDELGDLPCSDVLSVLGADILIHNILLKRHRPREKIGGMKYELQDACARNEWTGCGNLIAL